MTADSQQPGKPRLPSWSPPTYEPEASAADVSSKWYVIGRYCLCSHLNSELITITHCSGQNDTEQLTQQWINYTVTKNFKKNRQINMNMKIITKYYNVTLRHKQEGILWIFYFSEHWKWIKFQYVWTAEILWLTMSRSLNVGQGESCVAHESHMSLFSTAATRRHTCTLLSVTDTCVYQSRDEQQYLINYSPAPATTHLNQEL